MEHRNSALLTSGFPSQIASNAESVSMGRHQDESIYTASFNSIWVPVTKWPPFSRWHFRGCKNIAYWLQFHRTMLLRVRLTDTVFQTRFFYKRFYIVWCIENRNDCILHDISFSNWEFITYPNAAFREWGKLGSVNDWNMVHTVQKVQNSSYPGHQSIQGSCPW